tara:strand:+ start:181 stop:423 length:243 start_codon:yes stop_codon:yes gene_type:complete
MSEEMINIDATACLQEVVLYIRGDTNLTEATSALYRLGMDKKSAGKVLRDTPRNNIYDFSTKSRSSFDSSGEDVGDIEAD